MQGTIVMMMALSGLGCHHKTCDVGYVAAPACYSASYAGCYSSCYGTPVTSYAGCYGGGCYGGGCYGGGCYGFGCYGSHYGYGCYGDACGYAQGHGHKRRGLFGGLCGKRRNACYVDTCCMGAPMYGTYTPVVQYAYSAPVSYAYPSSQALTSGQYYGGAKAMPAGSGQYYGGTKGYPATTAPAASAPAESTPAPAGGQVPPPPPTPAPTGDQPNFGDEPAGDAPRSPLGDVPTSPPTPEANPAPEF